MAFEPRVLAGSPGRLPAWAPTDPYMHNYCNAYGSSSRRVGLPDGTERGPISDGNNLGGRVWGTAVIDLNRGRVTLAEATIDVGMDVKFEERTSKISGTLAVRFERKEAWKGN